MRSRFTYEEISRGVNFGPVECDSCGRTSKESPLHLVHLSMSTAYYFTLCDDCLWVSPEIDESYTIIENWADDTVEEIE